MLDSVNLGFDDVLYSLFDKYAKNKKPISVDFRKIVPDVAFGSRATHLIHTYPAKLLPHIPYFFLNNNFLSQPGDNVLDPFCGSGTVLLEALLAERNAFGADSNPLARLITRVKTTSLDIDILKRSSSRLLSRIKETPSYPTPDFNNIEYWFYPHVIRKLAAIKEAIDQTRNKEIKDFFLVCFSNCTKKVSLADPRLSVPVRLRKEQYSSDHILRAVSAKHLRRLKRINVNNEFIKILNTNIKRLQSFTCIQTSNVRASIISKDARTINSSLSRVHRNQDLDLIITSPPYAGAQKYIRSSSLGMGWLGMCDEKSLKFYENLSIGREHYRKSEYCELVTTGLSNADNMLKMIHKKNPLRAHIAGQYILEMRDAFISSTAVLKSDAHLILIAANNKVCGHDFKTQTYLTNIIESLGFEMILSLVDDIHSRGLMTKRNKTASVISREWVIVFRKRQGMR